MYPAAAHAGGELDEELCAGLVELVHEELQLLEHLGILPQPLAPDGVPQGRNTGDNETDVVPCPLQEELRRLLVELTAGQLKPAKEARAAHGAHDDAVFDLNIPDLPGGKQGFIFLFHIQTTFPVEIRIVYHH